MEITLWYGDDQTFGQLGNPQRWVNLLGSVANSERLASLSYRLNGGPPCPLTVGPDRLRLLEPGDFNAEIPVEALRDGENEVVLTVVDRDGRSVTRRALLRSVAGRRWPLPYTVDWDSPIPLPHGVQVVDGQWRRSGMGIRPARVGYDRLVAVGDRHWRDYRITVPVMFHGREERAGAPIGGFGILLRWSGHWPDDHQPHREWRPSGAIGWYRARWESAPARWRCLNISDGVIEDRAIVETPPCELELEAPYRFQFGVRSRPGRTSRYRFQVWREGRPEAPICDLEADGTPGEATHGSALLIALHVDLTIGNIAAEPL